MKLNYQEPEEWLCPRMKILKLEKATKTWTNQDKANMRSQKAQNALKNALSI